MVAVSTMPHSTFEEGFHQNGSGMAKCPCGQTFDFASERDRKMKQLHHIVGSVLTHQKAQGK